MKRFIITSIITAGLLLAVSSLQAETLSQDLSGNGFDITTETAIGNVGYDIVDFGGRTDVLSLVGNTGPGLTVVDGSNSLLIPGTDSYSMSLWYYREPSSAYEYLLNYSAGTFSSPGYALQPLSNGRMLFRGNDADSTASSTRTWLLYDATNLDEQWNHMVITLDRTTDTCSLYNNGSLLGTASIPVAVAAVAADEEVEGDEGEPAIPSDIRSEGRALYIGGIPENATGDLVLDGYMDDIAFYQGALSAADVTTLYNTTSLDANTIATAGITPVMIHTFEAVPEPSTIMLLLAGIAGLMLVRRRK